jgi:DNA-binding transcriptional MerR regulator
MKMSSESGYSIGAMAARCHMTAHTLRYYERVKLIEPVERGHNGHRRYSDADESWLKLLQFLRTTHMPIRKIQRYAALRADRINRSHEQRKILEEHQATLESQIAKLKEALALLAAHIERHPQRRTEAPSISRAVVFENRESSSRLSVR